MPKDTLSQDIIETIHTKLKKVLPIVKICGKKILKYHRNNPENLNIIEKDNQEGPLTQADQLSHQILSTEISRLFPEDLIFSEEGTLPNQQEIPNFSWCIDPIDGTKAFIRGHTDYMIQIGLLYEKQPVLGILYQPNFQTLLYGSKAKGVWLETPLQQKKIKTPITKKRKIRIASSKDHSNKMCIQKLNKKLHKNVSITEASSVGYKTLLCLTNITDTFFYTQPLKIWDVCAPHAILKETQGDVTGIDLKKVKYESNGSLNTDTCIFSWNNQLSHQIIDLIKGSN